MAEEGERLVDHRTEHELQGGDHGLEVHQQGLSPALAPSRELRRGDLHVGGDGQVPVPEHRRRSSRLRHADEAQARASGGLRPLHLVADLIDKNLLMRSSAEGAVRISMLQVLREYGNELLKESGEDDDARSAHAAYYARLAAAAGRE